MRTRPNVRGLWIALSATVVWAGVARAADPTLAVNLYGSIDYRVAKEGAQPVANSFSIPQIDLLISSALDRLSFDAEIVVDGTTGNEFRPDVDRVSLSFLWRSWMILSGGRFPTGIGYYNTAYPFGGSYFELPVDRPLLISSDESAALLPTEGIGVRVDGRVPLGAAGFASYDVEVTNGRGYTPAEFTIGTDHDNPKAVNVRLRYEPAFLDGLIIGGNAYRDTIPASPVLPVRLVEEILGAHIAYVEAPWHLILEGVAIRHAGNDGSRYLTLAGLGQLGYNFGSITPYLRVEVTRFQTTADPFYALGTDAARGSYITLSGGVKWTASAALAFKLELEENHATVDNLRSVTAQGAFAF